MTETIYLASDNSTKAFMALIVPPITLLILIGGIAAVVIYVRKRTGRPKKASLLSFFGALFLVNAFLRLTEEYTSTTWLSFFFLLAISLVLFAFGYQNSELRNQLRRKPPGNSSESENNSQHGNHAL
ncbi:hypothetical protein [Mycobacteroides abscessus]|uniref:hypothetical protein n=1 Tax=Mycobacteroides abscessus TaxID=36809 RepID=UPI000D3E7AD0|nr:hypothetical protein [Mycobacteroides abscessus]PVA36487.1 hypothetical protein DDJ88_11775 [Mycobacteroides abscessus]PVA43950.1 hypothetical protein DDJ35_20605 [Mycobacteroides abscessus]RIQ90769.1 hypothetical protein D2E34_12270 [Mycobacteroides abscessus]RIQ98909.1 hypothetical protein D2E30_09635 [Mycobacteroides abscessus]